MSEKLSITIKSKRTLMLPLLPNFFRDESGECVDIATLTDEQIDEVGKHWTDALKRKSHKRKREYTAELNKKLGRRAIVIENKGDAPL